MQIIPAIDLYDNKVVRLEQGDFKKIKVYSNIPLDMALRFKEAGINRIHIVDLNGAEDGKPFHHKLAGEIKEKTGLIIETGGGIRNLEHVETLWSYGLKPKEDFVMIGSLPIKDPEEFDKILTKYVTSILLTIDVWGNEVKISGWKQKTGIEIKDLIKKMIKLNVTNFLVTQIKKDGMLSGPDFDLYKKLSDNFSNINLIASGGVSQLNDFRELKKIPQVTGAILGKAYYENKITLSELQTI